MHMYIICWRPSQRVCTAFVIYWAYQNQTKENNSPDKIHHAKSKTPESNGLTIPHAMINHYLGTLESCPWFGSLPTSLFRFATISCAWHTASNNVPIWKSMNTISCCHVLHFASDAGILYRFFSFSSPSSSLYEPQPLWFFQLPKHNQQNSWRHFPHVWN